ncbi:MAG: hypothetical protein U1E87_04970 [Alphaproteobacteria bacterium]
MIRVGAVSVLVLAASLASHEASAKPRAKSARPAAHRTVPTPKPKPEIAAPATSSTENATSAAEARRMVVASYVPIAGSKKLPRGFRGPRQAPNRAVVAAAAATQMAALAPSQPSATGAGQATPLPATPQLSAPAADTPRTLEGRTAKISSPRHKPRALRRRRPLPRLLRRPLRKAFSLSR